jgi:hypothetical protein
MRLPLEQIMIGAYSNHIKTFADLKTTYEETRAGFIEIALEKSRQAIPFKEIFNSLKSSYMANAANLTKKDQMISLVDWLVAI